MSRESCYKLDVLLGLLTIGLPARTLQWGIVVTILSNWQPAALAAARYLSSTKKIASGAPYGEDTRRLESGSGQNGGGAKVGQSSPPKSAIAPC